MAASAAVSQGTLTVLPYQLMPLRTRGAPFTQSEPSRLANSSSEGAAATLVGIRHARSKLTSRKGNYEGVFGYPPSPAPPDGARFREAVL